MKQADTSGWGISDTSVAGAYANQVAYCRNNDAPITARIVAAIGAQLDDPDAGAFVTRIRDWSGKALADAVPLRSAGGLHALHLAGAAPALSGIYGGEPADDVAIVRDVIGQQEAFLMPWLDGPPQTNEAGRSSNFIAAMLWLAAQGLPPRFECFEIGSSAGINLMIDRYRYDLGGVIVGPHDPVIAFTPEWRGPPPPDCPFELASLKGCDVAPVDLTDPVQALRLKAYIWPEHVVRFGRLEAAVAAARQRKPDLTKMHAADFVEQQLARPQPEGTTRLLMHSIVWQYLAEDEKQRITAAMEAAGARATAGKALAWISLEADRTLLLGQALRLRCWPCAMGKADEPELIATAHAHGAWIDWRAGA